MENKDTSFELLDITSLTPYANNARTHSDEQISKIAASIKEFGFLNPIIISEDNTILCGHGRYYAAQRLGLSKVPCIRESHLSETQRKAYILADNRLAEDAGWDNDLLKVELETLKFDDFDVDLIGFSEKEINALFDTDHEGKEDDFDVDEELNKPTFSKPGDIWHLGKHTIICGSSTEEETFAKLLGETKVNLVCTDAPYFVKLESASGSITNDDLNDKDAYEFLMKAFTNFKAFMTKDASIYEFYATMKSRIFYDAFEDAGFKVGATLIWKKPRAPFMRTDWKFNMEPVIFGWRKDGKHIWYGDQKQHACFEFDMIKSSKEDGEGHPSSKPVPLIAYLIKQCTQINGIVLDGFLGSASTLIACEQLDRICYGVELEPKFIDVAVNRYKKFKEGVTDDIFLIRDGKKLTYEEAQLSDKSQESQ